LVGSVDDVLDGGCRLPIRHVEVVRQQEVAVVVAGVQARVCAVEGSEPGGAANFMKTRQNVILILTR